MTLPINFKTVFHSSSVSPAMKEKKVSRALLNGNENENDPVNDPAKGEETLEKNLHSVYNIIKGNPSATYSDIANQLNKSIATVKRNLQKLKEFGIIKREGADKTGRWIIMK